VNAPEESAGPGWAPGLAHRTRDVPPVEFQARVHPDDFRVEEIPAFAPAGEGDHVLFEIEKVGLGTPQAIGALARVLGVAPARIGCAGLKDAGAVARQWLSVEGPSLSAVEAAAAPGVRVLRAARHPHKLRVGKLLGNRFELVLRGLDARGHEHAARVLVRLSASGLPNYFGPQRFGRRGETWKLGAALLVGPADYLAELARQAAGDAGAGPAAELMGALGATRRGEHRRLARLAPRLEPELAAVARQLARRPLDLRSAARAVPKTVRRFHFSALQARAFNRVLAARIDEIDRLAPGDVAFVHASGAAFPVEELGPLAARVARFELSPSGPISGRRLLAASGAPGAVEARALAAEGLDVPLPASRLGFDARGARRPLRVPLAELEARAAGPLLSLRFRLPPGSYASALLEELGKAGTALQSPPPQAR